MADSTIWWLIAGVLVAAELMTGTFYLLMIAIGMASAALAASLASRLPELLDSRGSIMFALTWKAQVTPQRRLICALRAQAHRTSDKGYIGWPTPTTSNAHSYPTDRAKDKNRDLPTAALMVAWSTPCAMDGKGLATFPSGSRQANINRDINRMGLASGKNPNGLQESITGRAQLNPAHSRWLMGYPEEWDDCAPTGTQSSRKSPPCL